MEAMRCSTSALNLGAFTTLIGATCRPFGLTGGQLDFSKQSVT